LVGEGNENLNGLKNWHLLHQSAAMWGEGPPIRGKRGVFSILMGRKKNKRQASDRGHVNHHVVGMGTSGRGPPVTEGGFSTAGEWAGQWHPGAGMGEGSPRVSLVGGKKFNGREDRQDPDIDHGPPGQN